MSSAAASRATGILGIDDPPHLRRSVSPLALPRTAATYAVWSKLQRPTGKNLTMWPESNDVNLEAASMVLQRNALPDDPGSLFVRAPMARPEGFGRT